MRPPSPKREVGEMAPGSRAIRERLTYANVMVTVLAFIVLAGGGAYAASKIGASDIAKNAVRSKHVKNGQVKGADIAESAAVKGRGTLLSNRLVFTPGPGGSERVKRLLVLPGLGELRAFCAGGATSHAYVDWHNTTSANVDYGEPGGASVAIPGQQPIVAVWPPDGSQEAGTNTVTLGLGNDPGARRFAVVHVFVIQKFFDGLPCRFGAQATLWRSG